VWTVAEAHRFGDHVCHDRLYPLWRLLLMTGLRRGELCGLKWCDLEPDLATLRVRRQRVVEDPNSRVHDKPPKSHHGTRSLLLDPVTLTTLTDAKGRTKSAAASRYMFTGRTGSPAAPANVCGPTTSPAGSTDSPLPPAPARSGPTRSATYSPQTCSMPGTAFTKSPNGSATTPAP
jgi:integrase